MRALADDDRTVIAVTHEVAHLHLCDRVLVLVPLLDTDGTVIAGGRMAYYGPPDRGLEFFGKPNWAAVFEAFGTETTRDWAGEFASSPYHAEYVVAALDSQMPQQAANEPGPGVARRRRRRSRGSFGQFKTLCRRYLSVIAADRAYLAYTALLPVVLGLTLRILSNAQGLVGAPHTNSNAQLVLLILALAASLNGASSSVEELIKERPIYHRERGAGLRAGAYLWSKVVVLGTINIIQAAVLVGVGLVSRPQPSTGVVLHSPVFGIPAVLVEIWVAAALLEVVSMALGLLISAFARTVETVFQLLVGVTLAQVVMSGGARQFLTPVAVKLFSYGFPAHWAYAGTASTLNLSKIGTGLMQDPRWRHASSTWLHDMGVLAALGLIITNHHPHHLVHPDPQ
jgi:hypothetical protein